MLDSTVTSLLSKLKLFQRVFPLAFFLLNRDKNLKVKLQKRGQVMSSLLKYFCNTVSVFITWTTYILLL